MLLLVWALAGPAIAPAQPAEPRGVRVWVELREPATERERHRVLQALSQMGASPIASTRLDAAIAVRIAPQRLDAVRALPGVRRVRIADVRPPPRLNPPAGSRGVDEAGSK